MATKLTGRLMLNKIPKEKVIRDTDKNGNPRAYIWVDLQEKKEPDQYGNTHTLTMYNKETKETIYLGNFKPQEFGGSGQAQQSQPESNDDLPWD